MTDVIDITFVTKTEQLDRAFQKVGRLEKEIQKLAVAEAKGQITSKQYTAQVNKLASELQKVSGGTIQARNAIMAYSRTTREAAKEQAAFAAAAQASQKAMHRKGVVMQQAGYQVGDFLVQVQSGTNAFVAFGQQATQLVGVMGMLNPALIGLSAGLGIVIPLLTAVGAYFMRTKESAEEAADSFNGLGSAIGDLEQYSVDLVKSNEAIKESFKGILDVVREVKQEALQARLDEIIAPYEDEIRSFERRMANYLRFGGRRGGVFEPELDTLGFSDVNRAAQAYNLLRGIQGETKEELAESVRMTELWLRGSGLLTDEVKKILAAYSDVIDLQEQATDKTAGSAEQQVALYDKMNLQLLQQLDLQEKILQYGKDSFEVNNLRVEQSIDAFNQQVEKLVEVNKLTSEQGETLKIVNADMERATQATTLFRDILSEVASVMGTVSVLSASVVRNLNLQNLQSSLTYSGRGGDPRSFTGDYTNELGYKTVEDLIKEMTKSGGGKSEAEQLAERIQKFEEQLALEKELVGVSEARARILKALGADFIKDNPKIVEGYEAQIEAVEKLKEQEAGLKSFGETLRSSLGEAFMSIVDGSKSAADAFKDMARMVIKKALELSVINPLLNMLFGGMGMQPLPTIAAFQANGGAWRGGNVTAFADGGVVGGPTYFPMSGGRTGLMGEAGPEAIMPLKRGPDGKLGVQSSGNNITVNQTINVSTGVQQTVRTEVKSLMPQIADAAKAAVVDARRRGEMGMA